MTLTAPKTGSALAAAVAVAMLAVNPAAARPIPDKGLTLEEVRDWLRDEGYRAEVITQQGERVIRSGVEGVTTIIVTQDCQAGNACQSLQLSVGFDLKDGMTLARANEWNRTKRWAMVSLDDTNDPYLSMDINLAPGSSFEALSDSFGIWMQAVSAMKTFIDW